MRLGPPAYAAVLFLSLGTALRADMAIHFEGLADLESITTQYPGLTFGNTIVLVSGAVGGMLNELEFPPRSEYNVASDSGGPISILFSSPVLSFRGYFTYLTPLTLTAFDAAGQPLASTTSLFSNNLLLSGDLGSMPNELLGLGYAGGISRVQIAGDPLGGSFTMDDVSVTAVAPEPQSIWLLLTALAVCGLDGARRRRRQHQGRR